VVEPPARYPIGFDREAASYAPLLPVAHALKEELDRRGAALVLGMVPYGNTRKGHLPFLARELGVPVVLPSFDGVVTADGSHLARSSGESYGKAFWGQLLALPEVREKLSLDDPAPKAD